MINKAIFLFSELFFFFFPSEMSLFLSYLQRVLLVPQTALPGVLGPFNSLPRAAENKGRAERGGIFHLGRRHFPLLLWQEGEP